jgi:hypothetical protein
METEVKCNKTLFHSDGSESFTKGMLYSGRDSNSLYDMKVINNQGEPHTLSTWAKHFTVKKKGY